jgi:hypothetical protein
MRGAQRDTHTPPKAIPPRPFPVCSTSFLLVCSQIRWISTLLRSMQSPSHGRAERTVREGGATQFPPRPGSHPAPLPRAHTTPLYPLGRASARIRVGPIAASRYIGRRPTERWRWRYHGGGHFEDCGRALGMGITCCRCCLRTRWRRCRQCCRWCRPATARTSVTVTGIAGRRRPGRRVCRPRRP